MNWEAWGPTLVSVITMIFVAGKTYGRINGQELTLKRHDDTLTDHDERIGTLEGKAMVAKAWRDGYSAGSGTHHAEPSKRDKN